MKRKSVLRNGIRKAAAVLTASAMVTAYAAPVSFASAGQAENDVHAASAEGMDPASLLASMTLDEKIEQMIIPSARNEEKGGGITQVDSDVKEVLRNHDYAGLVFFAPNCQSTEQMTRMTAEMQRAASDGITPAESIPLLMSIDQEGGRVNRIGWGTLTPGNMALAASYDPENAEKNAFILGDEMSAAGFNMDFAPVLDVNNNPENPVINVRSFGSTVDIVKNMGNAFIKGLHRAGVVATLKHFPGHGNTDTDSHTGLPSVNSSLAELQKTELAPFQAGIDAGADMIMTAHIVYPQIEKDTYKSTSTGENVGIPATLSDDIITGVLREKMGFDGVVVTDSMHMGAIRDHFDPQDAAEMAINAGVDLLLMPGDITTEEHVKALDEYVAGIADRVRAGKIDESKIDAAVTRILKLKEKMGLLDQVSEWKNMSDADVDALVKKAESHVGSTEHVNTMWDITKKTTTLLKNDNSVLPISSGHTVVLVPEKNSAYSVDAAEEQLSKAGKSADMSVVVYDGLTAADAAAAVAGADNIIAVSNSGSLAKMDPSASGNDKSAFLHEAVRAAHDNGASFTLIAGMLPYEAAAYQDADAIMISYGYKLLSQVPDNLNGKNPDYGPNIPAAICAAYGGFVPSGYLPVDIPAIDTASYRYSDKVLYELGYGLQNWNVASIAGKGPVEDKGTSGFTDVKAGAWYADAVKYAVENGITKGTSETTFSPEATVTRAALVTMVHRMEGEPQAFGVVFDDVAPGAYYADAVGWANESGIVEGSNGMFMPDRGLSRQDLCCILYRYAKYQGKKVSLNPDDYEDIISLVDMDAFSDKGRISSYAADAVEWAVNADLVKGVSDGTLDPAGTVTRAQLVTILQRYAGLGQELNL